MSTVATVLWLSAANASIAFTVAESKLFGTFRDWTRARSPFLGELVACGYCLGHWTALGLVAVYQPRLFHAWGPLDYLLTVLVLAWLSAFQWAALCWLCDQAGK